MMTLGEGVMKHVEWKIFVHFSTDNDNEYPYYRRNIIDKVLLYMNNCYQIETSTTFVFGHDHSLGGRQFSLCDFILDRDVMIICNYHFPKQYFSCRDIFEDEEKVYYLFGHSEEGRERICSCMPPCYDYRYR